MPGSRLLHRSPLPARCRTVAGNAGAEPAGETARIGVFGIPSAHRVAVGLRIDAGIAVFRVRSGIIRPDSNIGLPEERTGRRRGRGDVPGRPFA
jgi:hypothetical protein